MRFARRKVEAGLLTDSYSQAEQQKTQIVIVEGAVASGKTALLHCFTEEISSSGALILTAIGSRAERAHPFGVLSQLCHEVHDRELRAWADSQVTALLSQDTAGQEPVPIRHTAARIADSLCSALEVLAAGRTIVIVIDDVHHADAPSLQILLYMLRRLRHEKLLVLVSEWIATSPAHPTFRAELLRQPNCHRILVQPLSVAEVAEVLTEHVDEPTAARIAPAYHEVCGGNPLLLRALVADGLLHAVGGDQALPPTPCSEEAFRQAVFTFLYRWGHRTLTVTQALAVLGARADPALVGELVDIKAARVERIVRNLVRSQLVCNGQLRHPAIRAAVLETQPLEERLGMHLHAAQLLHDNGADAIEVSQHLVVADRLPGQWAVSVLHSAGTQACADDRVEFALRCLELARRECQDEQLRATLTLSLARETWYRDPSAAARHLTPLKKAVLDGFLRPQDALTVALYLFWHNRSEEAHEVLARLQSSSGAPVSDETAHHTLLEHLQQWLHLGIQVPSWGLTAASTIDGASATAPGSVTALAHLNADLRDGRHDQAAAWAEQALAALRLSDTTLGDAQFALSMLIHVGRPHRAEVHCEEFLHEARARRATTWEGLFTATKAEIALRRGALQDAVDLARQALRLLSPRSWGVQIGCPFSIQLLALTGLGRHDEGERLLRQAVPTGMFECPSGLRYLHARGHHHLAINNPQDAYEGFHRCGELMRKWSLDVPEFVPWRSDVAQAHLHLDRRDEARAMILEQLALPGGNGPRIRGMSLRVLAATEDLEDRPALLNEAVDLLRSCGEQVELACALAEFGRTHQELGSHCTARTLSLEAVRIAQECGAERACRLAHLTLGRLDSPHTAAAEGMESLSDAERRVAALAAAGCPNRKIASRLFITVSTVEQHLTRVYRKLNVKQRSELPRYLADLEESSRECA
ncbi:LuxR family transcriptional regulator [Streptomyces sp. CT34]|uniref:helix-turn-helix transcriptional regulator n=1 Tax=Streptomyces sp. CT34 TaxID=1553907 RepID=UPI0005BC6FB8|nr:LuxR family transcriptional regulator [Streptomyces sp. CT34]